METMTDNDRRLIELAHSTLTDYAFVESLIPLADSEYCREELKYIAHYAFKSMEALSFDL